MGLKGKVAPLGIEPRASSLSRQCFTTELRCPDGFGSILVTFLVFILTNYRCHLELNTYCNSSRFHVARDLHEDILSDLGRQASLFSQSEKYHFYTNISPGCKSALRRIHNYGRISYVLQRLYVQVYTNNEVVAHGLVLPPEYSYYSLRFASASYFFLAPILIPGL